MYHTDNNVKANKSYLQPCKLILTCLGIIHFDLYPIMLMLNYLCLFFNMILYFLVSMACQTFLYFQSFKNDNGTFIRKKEKVLGLNLRTLEVLQECYQLVVQNQEKKIQRSLFYFRFEEEIPQVGQLLLFIVNNLLILPM